LQGNHGVSIDSLRRHTCGDGGGRT
jgi:hypothetical protein